MSGCEPIGYEVRPGRAAGDWWGVVLYAPNNGRVQPHPSATMMHRSKARAERNAKRLFERELKDWEWRNQRPTRIIPNGGTK